MDEVWKMDGYAGIFVDGIRVYSSEKDAEGYYITGPTFALRVCRAVLILAHRKK